MKKLLLIAGILLIPVVVTQSLSTRQFGLLRAWMAERPSDTLLVGVEWPFSINQDGFDKGITLAQEELNVHGVRGRRIDVIMRDDHMDREECRRIAIDFSRNPRMVATIGYYDDRFAVRSSSIFEESQLLNIIAGANNTFMTTHGFRYIIRTVLANDHIGYDLARMCMQRGYKTYAIISEEGAFGEDLAYQFGIGLDALNLRVVHQSTYVRGNADFRDTVNELKDANADVIFFAGFETESARFIKTARNVELNTPILGSFSDTPEVHAIAGRALEGVMFYDLYDTDSPTPENQAFVAKFHKRFGVYPDVYAAQAYDSLQLLARAFRATGSANSLDLAYAIRYAAPWQGANGLYQFDPRGELADKEIFLKMYRRGRPQIIGRGDATVSSLEAD